MNKLEKLPRPQRLRKLVKVFTGAEYRLSLGQELSAAEFSHLKEALDLFCGDEGFPPAALIALKVLQPLPMDRIGLRRALNTIRHILLSETGQVTADWDFIGPQGGLDAEKRRVFPGMRIYLEDIRSPFNVGAIFRTAESFGVEHIGLSPLCADPRHPRAARTAMGCVAAVPWDRLNGALPGEDVPFPEGSVFALETGGIPLRSFLFPRQGTMIVGSEELGVSPSALARAEASLGRVSIPAYGAKGSLNVTVAVGIALQAWAEHLALVTCP